MQNQVVLPFKRRVDIHGIGISFEQYLQSGETIETFACVVEVFSGLDSNPSHMLDGLCQLHGDMLYQQVKLGEIGVIYLLVFSATTNQGNTYEVTAKLAVLEDSVPAGPIYQYRDLSSTPYPYVFLEAFDSNSELDSALEITWPVEAFDSNSLLISGSLQAVLLTYDMVPEALDSTSDIVSGSLDVLLIVYEYIEAFSSTSDLESGELYTQKLVYSNYPPEAFDSSSDIISGTLV